MVATVTASSDHLARFCPRGDFRRLQLTISTDIGVVEVPAIAKVRSIPVLNAYNALWPLDEYSVYPRAQCLNFWVVILLVIFTSIVRFEVPPLYNSIPHSHTTPMALYHTYIMWMQVSLWSQFVLVTDGRSVLSVSMDFPTVLLTLKIAIYFAPLLATVSTFSKYDISDRFILCWIRVFLYLQGTKQCYPCYKYCIFVYICYTPPMWIYSPIFTPGGGSVA